LTFQEIINQFITDISITTWYEYVAVFAGIISVWFSKKENILVYPTGLLNTIIYIFISFKGRLFGEATVNFYYTIMSVLGWYMWTKKNASKNIELHITRSTQKEWLHQLLFFSFCYAAIYFALIYLKNYFPQGIIPWADAFASATAFTGMWLMTKKKVESWYWWLATNITSIPLYFAKHYVFTSLYYVILFIMAIFGLVEWLKKTRKENKIKA
jgi:nicotinamide mononucleotide transporter